MAGGEMISAEQHMNISIRAAFKAALAEACRFAGATAPNPPVGCALLDEYGKILTVAAHHRAGTMHAEARALAQAETLGLTAQIATAVVTLEPCNHAGRTPACSEALLRTPVQTIWIGAADPNPHVAGGGAARLLTAGRSVFWLADAGRESGDLLAACQGLIAPFVKQATTGRAWLTVKQALDASGSMVPPPGRSTFTSSEALTLAHRLRRATDAIVTATGTVQADMPGLDVRRVADHEERAPRLLIVCGQEEHMPMAWRDRVEQKFDLRFCADIRDVPHMVAEAGGLWALVEAGPRLLSALRANNVWDDWLTISVGSDGHERMSVESRHAVSPLSLFLPEARGVTGVPVEDSACFPVS